MELIWTETYTICTLIHTEPQCSHCRSFGQAEIAVPFHVNKYKCMNAQRRNYEHEQNNILKPARLCNMSFILMPSDLHGPSTIKRKVTCIIIDSQTNKRLNVIRFQSNACNCTGSTCKTVCSTVKMRRMKNKNTVNKNSKKQIKHARQWQQMYQ